MSLHGSPSAEEGATATFMVILSGPSDEDISVEWETRQAGDALAQGETAKPGDDYTVATGTVAITAGNTNATFTVDTTEDTLAEGDETFRVTLDKATKTSTPRKRVPLGVAFAVGTILDNDTAPDGLIISVTPSSLTEDAGPTDLTVSIALDGTAQLTVNTPVTVEMVDRPNVSLNATLGEDYTATTANVVIPAGQSSVDAVITLTPADDRVSEEDENAHLTATSSLLSGSGEMSITITDNDVEPVEMSLTVSPDSVDESASVAVLELTASLVGTSLREVDTVVSVSLVDVTATAGEDYEAATATLTIPAGEESASANFSLTVLEDSIHEGEETLQVTGTTPGLDVLPDEIAIQDNDAAPTSIGLSADAIPITESGGSTTVPIHATLLGGGTRAEDTVVTLSVVETDGN